MIPTPSSDLPRVLIVAAAPLTKAAGSGVTLSNLFHAFPPSNLAQLHLDPGSADPSLCGASVRLMNNGSRVEGAVRKVASHLPGWSRPEGEIVAARDAVSPATLRAAAAASATAGLDMMPVRVPPGVVAWAERFRAEVIYSPLGSIRIMRLVLALAERLSVPIVPHFMDDWPHTLFANGEAFGFAHRQVMKKIGEVTQRSPRFLAISASMVDDFEPRLGIHGSVFMNCVADDDFASSAARSVSPDGVRFGYVGGLHLDRWRLLRDLSGALARTAPSSLLEIHAPKVDLDQYAAAFAPLANVRWGPQLDAGDVAEALQRFDVLVHVESFAAAAQRFTRLSISTKIPQYMAAERPILAIGPLDLASIRLVEDARAGVVVTREDSLSIDAAISSLVRDSDLRTTLAENGRRFAEENNVRESVAESFAVVLRDVAAKGRERNNVI